MFYIEEQALAFYMEQRSPSGDVKYSFIPKSGLVIYANGDQIVFENGLVIWTIRRDMINVSQAESIEALIVAYNNPSPDILPGGGGGGGGGGDEETWVITNGNYSILSTVRNIKANGQPSNFRLPTIAPSVYGLPFTMYATDYPITALCDDPSGDRIAGDVSFKLKKGEVLTFICFEPNKWDYR
jgi:hypothetical protein